MAVPFRKAGGLIRARRMALSRFGFDISFGLYTSSASAELPGSYIRIDAGGVEYRLKTPIARHPSRQRSRGDHSTTFHVGTAIPTDIEGRSSTSSPEATLELVTTHRKRRAYAWLVLSTGLVIAAGLVFLHLIASAAAAAIAIAAASIVRRFDTRRRTFELDFILDLAARQRWTLLNSALAELSQSQELWQLAESKRNSDASPTSEDAVNGTRRSAVLAQAEPKYLATNVMPYELHVGRERFYFYPDRIYILKDGSYRSIQYTSIQIDTDTPAYAASGSQHVDERAVGATVEPSGESHGFDALGAGNCAGSTARCGVVELRSGSDWSLRLQSSSQTAVERFAELFRQSSAASNRQSSIRQGNFREGTRTTRAMSSPTPPTPDSYRVLGLTTDSTRDEVFARYRELAKSYHPDRVFNLPQEFQALAHQKMAEINAAFSDLKRSRGW